MAPKYMKKLLMETSRGNRPDPHITGGHGEMVNLITIRRILIWQHLGARQTRWGLIRQR